ncbi:type IX secretion system sortase PorU [Flavobacterium sp. HXWNR69]|uniref:Type IX secretion system sortase PorU n=1 Tax=Flavobacterium fragile TaxID=2949085 RepID=A0ABT0TIJ7_9FLAO|nr:type IX secretion system sortase PorU [Flavobacterium sp. HXWNR69]MCL9770795.1 type IX secretion system sortase PorU [Flavobacterium sp. HXWNR69]
MKKFLLFLFLMFVMFVYSQQSENVSISWSANTNFDAGSVSLKIPQFDPQYLEVDITSRVIQYRRFVPVSMATNISSLSITNLNFQTISETDLYDLNKKLIPTTINAKLEIHNTRNTTKGLLILSPIIKEGNIYKKLISFTYSYQESNSARNTNQNVIQSVTNSVLTNGSWYRFYVEKSGVYKISKSFLQSLGFNVNTDPRNIKIYGNGGKMLPLLNATYYPNDLEENAIQFIGEEDGVFDNTDYILFYAEGVDTWNSESLTSVNLFADKSYYYVTSSGSAGKRITNAVEPTGTPNLYFSQFDDVVYHEKDLVNAGKVGRRWFGEQFNIDNSQTFNFSIPNIDVTVPVQIKVNTASKSFGNSSFNIKANTIDLGTLFFPQLTAGSGVEGYESALSGTFTAANSDISVLLTYDNGGVPSSNGYLDFIRIKTKRNLVGYAKQFNFFNEQEQNNIGIGEYKITNAAGISQVWDVTDLYNVTKYENTTGANFNFKVNLGSVRKYVAVDLSDTYLPKREANALVANQNIKGTIFKDSQGNFQDIDYLIISPDFLSTQAERLADFHRNYSGLVVRVVTLEKIYQEFSSGKQDLAAIRNFIKYVYWNASTPEKRVKFVNLFGDASYDYKDRVFNNTNIVPVFHGFNPFAIETNNTSNFSLFSSFMSDDFFGLMDDNEGTMLGGFDGIDIAVGRMLVSSVTQAKEMVDKVIEYHDEKSYGRWRNNYVIYSDDADNLTDSTLQFGLDGLANTLVTQKPFVNVKKIHSDSYIQQVAAGGERYPDAKKDFLDALELGALVFNYFGHGNEEFLARERLFEKLEAQNLTNRYRYPLFITITCEFTRFDDPNRFTGGEYMYWNKNGGAIGLIATTRQIGVTTGFVMNNLLSEDLYAYGSNDYPTIAEALRLTKINTGSDNRRVVFFIGDPALKLAIPKPKVILTKVNDVSVNQPLPVLQALSLVKISGEVRDENDVVISDYNGDLAVQIFDKDISRSTLANDGVVAPSPGGVTIMGNYFSAGQQIKMNFLTSGETVFRGNASVINGQFEFNFIMPQDIRIPVGNGKISFYSKRSTPVLDNQTGYDRTIQIGGVNVNAVADTNPPKVRLHMNDESFVSGGITNCSPILLAFLEDENGINTASGIGHDIVAILDGDESNPYILNEYYETENNDYTKGFVRFPFRELSPGLHTILFKVWDVYNNLVTAEIQFNAICSDEGLRIEKVLNYPNPFVSYTEFWFNHNMPFEPLDVQVQIVTISGKLVKTINQQVLTDGFLCRDIIWDGRDDFGDKIGKGVYVYKIKVRSVTTGKSVEKYEKLVIL